MADKYNYQFGENQKIIDEANLKADLIDAFEYCLERYKQEWSGVEDEKIKSFEILLKRAKEEN